MRIKPLLESKTVIALMGATATGKTDLVIQLANILPVSIISVDSALIYKGMDIGTAKPSKKTLAKYPHKLVDICMPFDSYSVATFIKDAKCAIDNAFLAQKIPILVGGTGFYFRTLKNGLSKMPATDKVIRSSLVNELNNNGLDYLYNKLISIDKLSASKIHKNDTQRIMRALEVFYISAKTLTEFKQQKKQNAINNPIKNIVLMPERALIHDKIATRFYKMLDLGFIDEVEKLYNNDKINKNSNSMRAVGYRQAWSYLDGDISKQEMIELAIIATRQLCKRQHTWLKTEQESLLLSKPNINSIINYILA